MAVISEKLNNSLRSCVHEARALDGILKYAANISEGQKAAQWLKPFEGKLEEPFARMERLRAEALEKAKIPALQPQAYNEGFAREMQDCLISLLGTLNGLAQEVEVHPVPARARINQCLGRVCESAIKAARQFRQDMAEHLLVEMNGLVEATDILQRRSGQGR
jgi:hypothetical protein